MKIFVLCTSVLLLTMSAQGQDLVGAYPYGGGPVTIQPTGEPIRAGGLEFTSDGPYLSNGSNPAPFQFFLTGDNKSGVNKVTMGSLGATEIAGPVTLDVTVSADAPLESVTFTWGPGPSPTKQPILDITDPPISGEYPATGGPITITADEPISASQMQFNSGGKNLLSNGSDPSPFANFVTGDNRANIDQVTLAAALDQPVTLEGSMTFDVSVAAGAELGDIVGTLGTSGLSSFTVNPVPEPAAGIMGLILVGVCLRMRPSRTNG